MMKIRVPGVRLMILENFSFFFFEKYPVFERFEKYWNKK